MMKDYITLLLLTICPLAVIAENEPATAPSPAQDFAAVAAQLEQGGDLYAIMQTRGVIDFVAKTGNDFIHALRECDPGLAAKIPPIDYSMLEKHLMLSQLKAIGASSIKTEGDDYSIRVYYHMDGKPEGIWKLIKTEPFPFEMIHHAPADATDVYEMAFDFTVLRDIANGVATDLFGEAGPAIVANFLSQKVPETDVTYNELLDAFSNQLGIVSKLQSFSPESSPPVKRDTVIRLKNAGEIAARLKPYFEQFLLFNETDDFIQYKTDPELTDYLELRLLKSDNSLWLASNTTLLENCLHPESSMASTDSYKKYITKVDESSFSYSYTSPSLSPDIQNVGLGFIDMIETMSAKNEGESIAPLKLFLKEFIGKYKSESFTISYLNDGGIMQQCYTKHAGRDYVITFSAAIPGVIVAMAVPAFMKVRNASEEKTITNNLRIFASTGQMYMLDNGIPEVSYEDIVGPGKAIEALESVAGESYEDLWMDIDTTELSVELPDGRVITYEF